MSANIIVSTTQDEKTVMNLPVSQAYEYLAALKSTMRQSSMAENVATASHSSSGVSRRFRRSKTAHASPFSPTTEGSKTAW